jgi:SAM-dependent methyltransferase
MKWSWLRFASWIDTRAHFVDSLPLEGKLLDLGSSDGGTLRHFAELRPDLSLAAADIAGSPENYPAGTDFRRANFDVDPLPWADASFDGITCMHVVEHLQNPMNLMREAQRVLKPGGRLYIETPAPETVSVKSATGEATGRVTMNFYDDPTHVRPVPVEEMERMAGELGFRHERSGRSRNWLFTASFPLLLVARRHSRHRYVAQIHWTGWSAYVILGRSKG